MWSFIRGLILLLLPVLYVWGLHRLWLLAGEGLRPDQPHHPQTVQWSQVEYTCIKDACMSNVSNNTQIVGINQPSFFVSCFSCLPVGAPWVWTTVPSFTMSVRMSVTLYVSQALYRRGSSTSPGSRDSLIRYQYCLLPDTVLKYSYSTLQRTPVLH